MKKKFKMRFKKIIATVLLVTFVGQPLTVFAAAVADTAADSSQKPTVTEVNKVTVVDIAAPNARGLSHNKYTDFNVTANGLILNNATQAGNTTLLGNLQANANFKANAASIILNEVTGTNRTNLNGMLEVAGNQAAVIIANPNGITGNGFGFINTNRVSLVTGTPNVDTNGSLDSFNVNSGDVSIEGTGISQDTPATKLDIMTRAANINAEVWADEINVVTGNNKVNYQTLATETIAENPAKKPTVALDVGVVGGMYAGKIMLVGTEKGLGVALDSEVSASKGLSLTNEGKITVNGSISAKEPIKITTSDDFVNNGQISSNQDINITAQNITSSGFISAGEEADEEDEDGNSASASTTLADLTANAAEKINISGMISASRDITLSGKKVTYEPSNATAQNITVNQSEPDTPVVEPETPTPTDPDTPSKEETKTETITTVINPKAPALPTYSQIETTKAVEKEQNLLLTADQSASGDYKPIIDKTASGVDLVQIATPNTNGISRNLYTDFNINTSGLILNNATKYASTQLGGYIDYNTRLGGISAKVILNEVTSTNPSKLNGFIEVAGNKASIVIANPNGMTVNGFGYINTSNATLSTGIISSWQNGTVEFYPIANGNILLQGDGLNASKTDTLNIIAKEFANSASELWATQLSLSADGNLSNNGKIVTTGSMQIKGQNLTNEENAVISSTGDLDLTIKEDILNQTAAINSDGNTTITGKSFTNKENAVLYSKGNLDLKVEGDINNQTAAISVNGKTNLTGNSLQNTANALLYSGSDLNVAVANDINNQKSTLQADGIATLNSKTFENQDGAYFSSGNTLAIHADDSLLNQASTLKSKAKTSITTKAAINQDGAVLQSEDDLTIQAENNLKNQASAIKTNGNFNLQTKELINQSNATISSGKDMDVTAKASITNQASQLESSGKITAKTQALTSQASSVISSEKDLDLAVESDITNKDSTIKSTGNTKITSRNFNNEGSSFTSAGDLSLTVKENIQNKNADIQVEGSSEISAKNLSNEADAGIFTTGDFNLNLTNKLTNQNSVLAVNGKTNITAQGIDNLDNSVLYSSGDLTLTAENNILNQSSDIESQGSIAITANQLTNEKGIFETYWDITNQNIAYGITPISGHYSATRKFARKIQTGTIKEETATAQILADKDITIKTKSNVINHYSTIAAGNDLTIDAAYLENFGYQGTIITTDVGNDIHNWKYKHHGKLHHHCHMVYGTTVIPYYNQTVVDEETVRPGILSGVKKVKITAGTIDNKTFDAGKNVIQTKTQAVTQPSVLTQLTGQTKVASQVDPKINAEDKEITIGSLAINSKLFTINTNPTAKYLVETNEKFANYNNFLSSDYLLERVKSDPTKVSKRLGDGYYEQKLVTEQITELTGKKYLNDYSSALEQYQALMENGATVANEYNLTVGVALTKEQMAALTSDIVWLVEEEVNGEKVLVPEVYLSTLKTGDLTSSGALIVGTDVELVASDDLKNVGTIKADNNLTVAAKNITNENGAISGAEVTLTAEENVTNNSAAITGKNVTISAENITNTTQTQTENYQELNQTKTLDTASIAAENNLTLIAEDSIKNQGAKLSAGKELVLTAKKDIDIEAVAKEKHVAVTYGKSSAEENTTKSVSSTLTGQNITINGDNVNIKGSNVAADEAVTITGKTNVNITAEKDLAETDASVGNRGGEYFNRQKDSNETIASSSITAGKDIQIKADKDINVKGSDISSNKGKITLDAKENVNVSNETEHHESLHEEHREKTGFLSSTKTDIYDYQAKDTVVGSNISGNQINADATKDINIKGSTAVADQDVNLKAGGNINIESAEETSESLYEKSVKKSGLLTGGGLSVTIGKQSQKDSQANQNTEQISSTVGSLQGNVTLEAGKDVDVKASDVIANKDINTTGENVNIENKDNTYNAEEKHEFKQSGLSVSLGGNVVTAVEKVLSPAERATQVQDDRLKALYAYETANQIEENADTLKDLGHLNKSKLSVSVSLGSSKSESESTSQTTVAKESNVKSDGDVNITSTKGDIKVKGSNVEGKDVTLDAKENIEITASENKNASNTESSSSSASIGVDLNLTGGLSSVNVSGSKQNGKIKENGTTYNQSTVTAEKDLTAKSGKDTNIIGSKVEGDKVKVDVGGDLNLESLQDKETYDEQNSSSGFNLSADIKKQGAKKPNTLVNSKTTGSTSKGNIDSNYESVTKQAEINAGQDGFDIEVGKNTDLKGAVISSDATSDKNKISTDTLTYSDIANKADYSASSKGVNYSNGGDTKKKDQGLTPNNGTTSSGSGSSTTKSAVADGTIEVRSNPNQDISNLSRDTSGSLNKLGKIFDKKKVQEQQELSALFGKEVFKAIGDLGLKEGSAEKVALDTFAGGVMSKLGGSSFASGAAGAGITQLVMNELKNIKDPAVLQWASAIVGAAAAKLVGGDAKTGASVAVSETKNNWLSHDEQVSFANRLKKALVEGDIDGARRIIREYAEISKSNSDFNPFNDEATEGLDDDGAGLLEQLQLYAALTNQTLTNNGLNYDLANLAAGSSNFALQLPENHDFDTSKTSDTVDQVNQPPETVDSVMDNGGSWNSAGQAVRADGTVYDNLPNRGNYAYSQGVQPSGYYDDGTAAIVIDGNYYPAYNAPTKGDKLAEDPNAKFVKIGDQNFVLDPDDPNPDDQKKCWATSKEPSAWQVIKQKVDNGIEDVVQSKDDIIKFKEQKDINYAKRQLVEKGIAEDDPEYDSKFAEEYKKAKEQSDAFWYMGSAKSVKELYSLIKAFKYTSSVVAGADDVVKVSVDTIIETATAANKGGETIVGHALQKHAGRNPEIWGKVKGGSDEINQTALKHLREIIDAPGDFVKVTNERGIQFLEKKLPDGRGARLNLDGTFKGFIDQ